MGFPTLIGRLLPGLPVPNFTTSSRVNDWTLGLHIGVPVFDSGRRSGQIKAATAQAEQARLAEEKLSLNVAREVTSYAELQSAQKRVKAMQEAVIQAQEIRKNEQTKYEVGRTVINFVLEAEAGVLNSQSLLSQAQRLDKLLKPSRANRSPTGGSANGREPFCWDRTNELLQPRHTGRSLDLHLIGRKVPYVRSPREPDRR